MLFDILDSLHTLPELVLETIARFLSVDHCTALACTTLPLLRTAFIARRWEGVCVGTSGWKDCYGVSDGQKLNQVSSERFSSMVRDGAPPPSHMRYLMYVTSHLQDDPLFMTPLWRQYIATHVTAFALDATFPDATGLSWEIFLRHLNELNLTGLWITIMQGADPSFWLKLNSLKLPDSLRILGLSIRDGRDTKIELVIPPKTTFVNLDFPVSYRADYLPRIPEFVETFKVSRLGGYDMSGYVERLPASLTTCVVLTPNHPAFILAAAVERLSSLRTHNMLVYHLDTPPANYPWLSWTAPRHMSPLKIDLGISTDYSNVDGPLNWALHVRDSLARAGMRGMSLLVLNHWLPRIKKLKITLPVSLRNAEIPSYVDVEVVSSGDIPLTVWKIPSLRELTVTAGPEWAVPLQLRTMKRLRTLVIKGNVSKVPRSRLPPKLRKVRYVPQDGSE